MKKKLLPLALALAMCLSLIPAAAAAKDPWSCISMKTSTEGVPLSGTFAGLERDAFVEVVSEITFEDVHALDDGTAVTVSNNGGNYGIYVYFRSYKKVGPNEKIQYNDYETGELITVKDATGKYYGSSGVTYMSTALPPWAVSPGEITQAGNGMYWQMDTYAGVDSTNILLLRSGESVTFTLPNSGPDTLYTLFAEYYSKADDQRYDLHGTFLVDTKTANDARASQPSSQPTTPSTSSAPSAFTDVSADAYYADPVKWAVEQNITTGTTDTTFSPNSTCSKAQILTFLYRANGSPEPAAANPFTDVEEGSYFYKAALWAAEKGIVSGTSFDANTPCTRAMTVEYMWKAAGSPKASYDGKFGDVAAGADYAQAVAWALDNGVTSGTSDTTFSPGNTCTRGQIVTFLYRALEK